MTVRCCKILHDFYVLCTSGAEPVAASRKSGSCLIWCFSRERRQKP